MSQQNLLKMMKIMGVGGFYLYLCRKWGVNPLPTKVPIFGTVRTFHELRNIFDNFGSRGQLEDEKVEDYLVRKKNPCVIDCGVNVGITVRWWFHLNRAVKVFGVDMIEEAHQFTARAIESVGMPKESYKPVLAALWSENGKQFKVGIGDPLFGDHGFFREDCKGTTERVFTTQTLDTLFASENLGEVDLLKVDLEGAGAETLKGATQLLKKTKHVVMEIHSEEECKLASQVLVNHGFQLRKVASRNLWWEKSE